MSRKASWAKALLTDMNITPTHGAVQGLVGWANAEGGHWNNDARHNPLNTTLNMPGASSINSVGVKTYRDWHQGLRATEKTLRLPAYKGIIRGLRQGDPNAVASAIAASPWGTNASLVRGAIAAAHPGHAGRFPASGGSGGGSGSISTPGYKIKRTQFGDAPTTTTDTDGAIVDALLHRKGGSLLKAVTSNLDSGQFTTTTPGTADRTVTEQVGGASSGQVSGPAGGGKGYLGKVINRANAIDARKLPYVYGGGHGGKSGPLTPLDCSAAVSKALGINVRVSGEFMKWGKPGEGGKITVYANPTHVLVKINGHFWGTSAANPGGGAGWIPAGHITPGYLSKFTARHL